MKLMTCYSEKTQRSKSQAFPTNQKLNDGMKELRGVSVDKILYTQVWNETNPVEEQHKWR